MSDNPAPPPRSLFSGTRARLIIAMAAAGICVVGGLSFILFSSPAGEAGAGPRLGRGIIDNRLEWTTIDPAAVPAFVQEIGKDGLGATWTRILVRWNMMQPKDGKYAADANGDGYADAYVAQLDGIITQFRAAGVTVILTPTEVPKWASNKALWGTQPGAGPGYKPFYAMNVDNPHVLGEFKALGHFLASHYEDKARSVRHFECWNEPNLGGYLYPQNLPNAPMVGPRVYLKMLKAYSEGVHSGADDALVIAGATSPRGTGADYSTAPQVFARFLKAQGAASLFDGYSHHPYMPGGTRNPVPDAPPNNPKRAVLLSNLGQITSLFPSKPFYLTEYGYNSRYSKYFGITVPEATQALYLRQAYALVAAKHPQVKAMLWFLVDDYAVDPAHPYRRGEGVYTGVRTVEGARKPSWYAFAGHNKLTLSAPEHAASGATFKLTGVLTYRAPEPPVGQKLTLQARASAGAPWAKVTADLTQLDGSYSFSVKQSATKSYRVVWDGVCESGARTVRTP